MNKSFLSAVLIISCAVSHAATPTKAQIQAKLDATLIELASAKSKISEDAVKYQTLFELYETIAGIQKMRAEAQAVEVRALKAEGDLARAQMEVMQLLGKNQALERKVGAIPTK